MSTLSNISILIVDDHEVIRLGLRHALTTAGVTSIVEAGSFASAALAIGQEKFNLVIIDQNLPDGRGIDLSTCIALNQPSALTILLTLEEEWHLAKIAERSEFSAYISKSTPLSTIVETIEALISGKSTFTLCAPTLTSRINRRALTLTELDVLREIDSGLTTREIALKRKSSEATIKSHLTSIYRKLGARNRVEAIKTGRSEHYL